MIRTRARRRGTVRLRIRTWRPLPHVPGESRGGFARRLFVLVLPGIWVAGLLVWEGTGSGHGVPLQLLAAAPAIACAGTGRRECVVLGGLCALLALVPLGPAGQAPASVTRLGTCAATLAVVAASYLTAGRRARLLRELALTRDVAEAAQRLVLRPLPPLIGGIRVATGHLSACEGALIGGDLYDAVPTRYGLRVVIGDVRGHGLAAIGTVSAMLGCFREAAHDEPGLPGVLRRLDRTLARHLADRDRAGHPAGEAGTGAAEPAAEEFVTVLLLQVTRAGEVTALNCGHPWPYRFSSRTAEPVADAEPLPPLGLFPLPDRLAALPGRRLERGEGLLLYTDGAEDARDARGAFFPLHAELLACLAAHAASTVPAPCALVTAVRERIARHAGGRLTDDVALLALADDRPPVPA